MKKFKKILNIPQGGRKAHIGALQNVDETLAAEIPEMPIDKVPEYELDFMVLCADDTNDLKSKCIGLRYVKYDGMLWLVLPKKSGETEEEVFSGECREIMKDNNVSIVDHVDINSTWQAFRVRPYERAHKYEVV